ncbi:unnamed protein product [Pleuronectes platessa]|uniref:Uncharacterized protein n=1 Tax=Pleuronectes platessa TaxID=8262 RepID=A0A9N7VSS9_PLEPL|nr:unnamed protein product [Pleuronectes platessa]
MRPIASWLSGSSDGNDPSDSNNTIPPPPIMHHSPLRQMDEAHPSLRRCGVTDDRGIDTAGGGARAGHRRRDIILSPAPLSSLSLSCRSLSLSPNLHLEDVFSGCFPQSHRLCRALSLSPEEDRLLRQSKPQREAISEVHRKLNSTAGQPLNCSDRAAIHHRERVKREEEEEEHGSMERQRWKTLKDEPDTSHGKEPVRFEL